MEITEQGRLAHNEYMRLYRQRNKEKIRAINNKYWNKKGGVDYADNKDNQTVTKEGVNNGFTE